MKPGIRKSVIIEGVTCPRCGSKEITGKGYIKKIKSGTKNRNYFCTGCAYNFSRPEIYAKAEQFVTHHFGGNMVYIGMFGLVAKIEVLDDECNGKWTVKILDIIKQSSDNKKYKMDDVNVGDIVRLDYGFLFNSKKLAISYAEESKKFVPDKWSGNSLLGLPF